MFKIAFRIVVLIGVASFEGVSSNNIPDILPFPSIPLPQLPELPPPRMGEPWWLWLAHFKCFVTGEPARYIVPSGWTHTCTRNEDVRNSFTASGVTDSPKKVKVVFTPLKDGPPESIDVEMEPLGEDTNAVVKMGRSKFYMMLEMTGVSKKTSYLAIATPSTKEAECYTPMVKDEKAIKESGKVTYMRCKKKI